MSNWVSPVEKRNFLKWFLDHQQLKRTDARKVLEFIVCNYHILENVSFTEKIILGRKTIVISSVNTDEPGFVFYYNQRKTDEVSTALGDLMMNPSEKVNIMIHFSGKMNNHRYLQLIDNQVIENIKQYDLYQKNAKEVDELIGKLTLEKQIDLVKNQIDAALDLKDEQLFSRLTVRLRELNKQKAERIEDHERH